MSGIVNKVGAQSGLVSSTVAGDGASLNSWTVYNTGIHTWTKPAGVKYVKVIVTGAGAGSGPTNGDDAGCGGGAGGTSAEVINVTNVATVIVTVGGGNSGSTNDQTGNRVAGTSSFGTYCTATGGNSTDGGWGPGNGGAGSSGDLNWDGGDGGQGLIDNTTYCSICGHGGGSYWGNGGNGGSRRHAASARSGGAFGSGGGGNFGGNTGGSGGNGVVTIEEYH